MPLNPPGGSTTFDAVRDEALKALGMSGAAPLDPDVLNTLMLLGLEQIYAQVWDWSLYEHTWTVTIDADDLAPDTVEATPDTVSEIFDPMYRFIHKVWRTRDNKLLLRANTYPEPATSSNAEPTALYWFTWGSTFIITPPSTQEETYEFFGYREISRSLFTESSGTITWQTVDLPNETIEIFQQLLQGLILNAVGDANGARQWLALADNAMTTLVNRNHGEMQVNSPPAEDFFYLGGNPTTTRVPTGSVVFMIDGAGAFS